MAVSNVTIAGFPDQIVVNQNTGKIYLSDLFANRLTVVDASTQEIAGTITLPGTPQHSGLAVDQETGAVYVAVSGCTNELNATNSCSSAAGHYPPGEIVEVDGESSSIVGVFRVDVQALAVDPATDTVYALGGGSNLTLVGIDGGSGALRSASDIGSSCAGAGGGNIAVDGSSGVVYAAFASQRYLLLIDGSTGRIVDMVNATGGIQSVAFDPGTNGAYVDMEAQGQGAGYLLALPAVPGQTYVNTGLLPQGVCVP